MVTFAQDIRGAMDIGVDRVAVMETVQAAFHVLSVIVCIPERSKAFIHVHAGCAAPQDGGTTPRCFPDAEIKQTERSLLLASCLIPKRPCHTGIPARLP